jgi:hypothetical protein
MKSACTLLIVLLCLHSQSPPDKSGGTVASEAPKTLSATDLVSFGIPSFSFSGAPLCDSAGDLYFEVSDSPTVGAGPFLKISANGKSQTIFALPPDLASSSASRGTWIKAVSPGGDFYLLHTDNLNSNELVRYNSDGSVHTVQKIAIPSTVIVQRLAILDTGVSLIQGNLDPSQERAKTHVPFAAIFSSDGKLIRDLSPEVQPAAPAGRANHPIEGFVTSGDDGRFYVLKGNGVEVLSPNGEIQAQFAFRKPDPSSIALKLNVSEGLLSVELMGTAPTKNDLQPLAIRMLLLDAQTGDLRGDYVFDPTLTNTLLCFTRKEGYSVYVVRDGKAAKQIVPTA